MKTILSAVCLVSLMPAISAFTLLDSYYGDILPLNAVSPLPAIKIAYPGLYTDVNDKMIGAGFLYQPVSSSSLFIDDASMLSVAPHASLGIRDLYAWGENKTGKGRFGFWVGNVALRRDSRSNDDIYNDGTGTYWTNAASHDYGGSIAAWYAADSSVLKGLSLVLNGGRGGQTDTSRNSSRTSDSSYTSMDYRSEDKDEVENIGVTAFTLFRLSSRKCVRIGLNGDYSKDFDSSYRNISRYSPLTDYLPTISNSNTTTTQSSAGFSLDIVDTTGRIYGVSFRSTVTNSSQIYHSNDITEDFTNASGSAGSAINYADGRQFNRGKHSAYLGVKAKAGVDFIFFGDSHVSFVDIPEKIRLSKHEFLCEVGFPVVINVNLFNTPFYAITRFDPALKARTRFDKISQSYSSAAYKYRQLGVYVNRLAVGIKGNMFDNLEIAAIPSLTDNVFVAGLEVKYAFDKRSANSAK